jgi:PAS domain S-box-containing protein
MLDCAPFQPLLDALNGVAYLVDRSGSILAVGEQGWSSFAAENGAEHLAAAESVIGQCLFNHVAGDAVRQSYRDMHAAVCSGRRPRIVFRYRCDAPDFRREMQMSISMVYGHDGHAAALYHSQMVAGHHRPSMDLLSHSLARNSRDSMAVPAVVVCSYCHDVGQEAASADGGGIWDRLEDYCGRGVTGEVRVVHGICPACNKRIIDPNILASGVLSDTMTDRPGEGRQDPWSRRAPSGVRHWLGGFGRLARSSWAAGGWQTGPLHAAALLRAVGDCSPDPIYAKDAEGRFLFANPAALAVIGRSANEVIGRTDADLHRDREQAASVMANDRRVIETRHAEVVEETVADAGRGIRVFRSAKAPLLAEDGTAAGVVGVLSDITRIKGAEAALRDGRERFRATFEQAAVGMAHIGPDGTWIRLNDHFCEMLGYRRAELLAKTFMEVTHPGDLPATMASISSLLAGVTASLSIEKRYIRKDGSQLWAGVTLSLVRKPDGAPDYFISVAEDISQRKAAEEALRESEQRFRSLFERAPLPGYLIDPADASIVDCNAVAAAMLGYGRDDLRRMRITDIDAVGVEIALKTSILEGRPLQFESRHRTRSGGILDVVVAAVPVDIAGRRLAHGTVVDITERKRAEAGLRDLTAGLEERVREEVAAREKAQIRAAQAERMQALGQLAGGIAHDFNNVLQAVQGSASMIGRRPGDLDAVSRYARIALEAADRGASITRRLLAFARRGDLRAEAISPYAILNGMRDILAPTLGSAVTVLIDAEPGLPQMLADKGQLETALVNLATNARDAMPQGGTLTLSAAYETVEAGSPHQAHLVPGSYLRITVADTGKGIDEEIIGRIFEPFFTTKATGLGTGLGLPMVKGFLEQSGGAIAVDSSAGRGTRIAIWLPQARHGVPGLAAGAAGQDRRGAADDCIRVLVVDDDPLVLETVAAQLEDEGFFVITAAGGTEALAMMDEGKAVQALVSDLSMPVMDGVSLILEAQARNPALPAVLLTGYAGDGVSLELGRRINGPFALMRKPSTGSDLAARIAALLADPATQRSAGHSLK